MMDVSFLLVTAGFGVLSWGLLVLCDRLVRGINERN
jgi:hypothetical protein